MLKNNLVEIYYQVAGSKSFIISNKLHVAEGNHRQQMVPYIGTWCISKPCSEEKPDFTTRWKNYMYSPNTDGTLQLLTGSTPPPSSGPGCCASGTSPTKCNNCGSGSGDPCWCHDLKANCIGDCKGQWLPKGTQTCDGKKCGPP